MLEQKSQAAQQLQQTIQLVKINQKDLAKERRLKRYGDRIEQYRQNRAFQNNNKKSYLQEGEECTKTYQHLDDKETKQFWRKIRERREHNRKAESINMEKEFESKNTPRFTQSNSQKRTEIQNARP